MFLKMVKTTNQDIVYIYIWTMMNFKHIPSKKGPFLFVGPRQAKRFLVRPGDRLAFAFRSETSENARIIIQNRSNIRYKHRTKWWMMPTNK